MKLSVTKLVLVVLFYVFFVYAGAQVLNITPNPVTFGSVNMGMSDMRSVTLSTTEEAGVVINDLGLSGDFAFSIMGAPGVPFTLYPSDPVMFDIMFSPMSVGMATAMLIVSPSGYPTQSVDVSGMGDPTGGMDPAMLNYPDTYDFGTWDVGSTGTGEIEVRLTSEWAGMYGTGQINNVTLAGSSDFSLGITTNTTTSTAVSFPYSLNSDDNVMIQVLYSPSDAGEDYATLEFETTDFRLYQVSLSGFGSMLAPHIVLDPNSLVIQTQEEAYTSSYFDIFNTGAADLTFANSTYGFPSWISLDVTEGTVAPGGSYRIGVNVNTEGVIADNYSYLLHITTNDPDMADQTIMITVVVDALPIVVDFSASPLTGHPPYEVSFTDNSRIDPDTPWASIIEWNWDFEDDGVFDAFVQNPVHMYNLPGLYSVRLQVRTNTGVISQKLHADLVLASNTYPQIVHPLNQIDTMVEDTQWGPSDVTYVFNDPDGDPVTITCIRSEHLNATISSGYLTIIPEHNWYGSETITLRAVDQFGKGPIQDILVTVAGVNDAPILSIPSDFYFIRNSHYRVDFSSYINDPDNADADISISLSPLGAANPITFTYYPINTANMVGQLSAVFSSLSQVEASGGFSIQVDDNMGRQLASTTFIMHVLDHFNPIVNLESTYQFAGQTVGFIDATLGNPDQWEWEFGDGNTSTEQNPYHQYLNAGTYDVYLTVRNNEANESAVVFIPGMIHLVGTAVTTEVIPPLWTLQGSPYNLYEGVELGDAANVVIQEDVVVNLFSEEPLSIEGSLNANGVTFRPGAQNGFWGGLRFWGDQQRNPSVLDGCQIIDAYLPLDIRGQSPDISNLYIAVSDTTTFADSVAIRISDSNGSITGAEILNYKGGVVIEDEGVTRTTPTLTNVRVRNSSSTLRTDLENTTAVTIRGEAIVNGLETDNFGTGISLSANGATTTTPTLTNVRVRNSSSTLRSVVTGVGIDIRGNTTPSLSDVEIDDVAVGIRLEDLHQNTRNTPTLTNVRVRNSSSTLRSVTNGIIVRNAPHLLLNDVEVTDFTTGILMQVDTRTQSTPTLTNVRVRNSSSTLRTASTGVQIEGNIVAKITDLEVNNYTTGLNYAMEGASTSQSTPTLTNVRVRNSSSTLRNETTGASFAGFAKLTINNMQLDYCSTGLKIMDADTRLDSTPTLTNVRVRNSTSTLRAETTGIYLGANVKGSLNGSEVDSTDVGILIAEGNRTVLDNNMIIDCLSGIRATGSNPLPLKRQVFVMQTPIPNARAFELMGNGPWTIHNNTIYGYPIGVKATNASVNFNSNILWNAEQQIPIPVQSFGGSAELSYNDIYYGLTAYPGTGNINADPCFASAPTRDFKLLRDSPCIDTGNPFLTNDKDGSCADVGAKMYFHKAAASVTPRFIVAGSSVNVNNISQGHNYPDTVVSWDIGNDGSNEYAGNSFSHTFTSPGLYDLKMRIQSGLLVDQVIYERFIVVSSLQLPSPPNPTLQKDGNDIVFSWGPVVTSEGGAEVPYYIVFKSDTPDGYFQYRGFTTSSQLPYRDIGAADADKAFYLVIGFDGTRSELNRYIDIQKSSRGLRRN